MSSEEVTRFLTSVGEDSELQEKARTVAGDKENPAAAAVALGSEHGFEFTVDEFSAAIAELAGEELGPDDLDQVAGGYSYKSVYKFGYKGLPANDPILQAGGLFIGSSPTGAWSYKINK